MRHPDLSASCIPHAVIVHNLARHILRTNRVVHLGRLIEALGAGSKHFKYANIVVDYGDRFRALEKEDLIGIYEGALYMLEMDVGPLRCEATAGLASASALPWGFAGLYAPFVPPLTQPQSVEAIHAIVQKRDHALFAGHPDSYYLDDRNIPMTIWHLDAAAQPVKASRS